MIPLRIQKYVDRVTNESNDNLQRKIKRLKLFIWFWFILLIIQLVETICYSPFSWTELVKGIMPSLLMLVIMGSTRDTLLVVLLMKDKNNESETK